MALDTAILAIIVGTLAAIIYALRILVLLERRIARIDKHIEMMAEKIVVEETSIEKMIKKNKSTTKEKCFETLP